MKHSISIRARLLIVYVGILVVGFVALALIAGQQISTAARADFEQRLQNEIKLVAQGIHSSLYQSPTEETLAALIEDYEAQIGGDLTLFVLEDPPQRGSPRPPYSMNTEIETALGGEVVVVERPNQNGENTLFTAAAVSKAPRQSSVVQLNVPLAKLQTIIWERWASLMFLVGLITVIALTAAALLARSIIRPLNALRQAAMQLSTGDFSSRVIYQQQDEIGAVAQAFNEMARQVESMIEEQRAFASNTSHELRTPLTTIQLRTEALRYDDQLDEETAKQYVREIDEEVRRMTALIEDLTLLSRFDAGRAELGGNEIDLGHFAASLRQRMLSQTTDKHLVFEVSAPQGVQPVCASLNHFTVVFRNLLDNAIKYTPEGGRITWRLSSTADGISSTIQDNGRGIDPDQLPHVFERFYRADKARSRDVPGSGLGLAIVKSIVEAYGGSISVESNGLGKGTSVTVFWPYQPSSSH